MDGAGPELAASAAMRAPSAAFARRRDTLPPSNRMIHPTLQARLRHRALWASLSLAVLAASSTALSAPTKLPLPTTAPVRFVILGDMGTGGPGQYAVAAAIGSVCAQRGCQFALGTGDNIYEYGVDSAQDPQFQEKFEEPYAKLSFPFFMVLGNHDQSGVLPGSGVRPERGNYEIEYSQLSAKWMMPYRYYRFAAPFAQATKFYEQTAQPIIEFFAIDTNHLAPQNQPVFDWYLPGRKYDIDQRHWLHEKLAASRASWKIVFGHHPLRNNGRHGNAGNFAGIGLAKGRNLKQMFEEEICDKVDLVVSGHDHSLQWLASQPECGVRPQFVISGAGATSYAWKPGGWDANLAYFQAYGTLGFFWAEGSASNLTLAAYTVDERGVPRLAFERTLSK